MVCISCPIGCRLTVRWKGSGDLPEVTGNKCPRGTEYGREEILAPKRTVTATVACTSRSFPRVPVRTTAPLGREHINGLLDTLRRLTVVLPVKTGGPVLRDFEGTGVDVIFTRSFEGN